MQYIKDCLPWLVDITTIYLPWVLSFISVYTSILAGNKHRNTWLISLFNQGLWLVWIIVTANWGFLPMNIAFWIVYYRNHLKWNKVQHGL